MTTLRMICIAYALAMIAARPCPAETPLPGLTQREGAFYKDGRPYRGVGVNYFDLWIRLHDPENKTSLDGLRRLGAAGVPFVRFAVGYDARDWKLFVEDREEYFRRLDLVVRTAEEAGVGLIPSLFWHFMTLPDLVDETRDQWGNPASRTHALMREVVAAVVERHRNSPAVWAYEFGNEANLVVDLPNAARSRKKGGTERDDLTSPAMIVMLTEFAREVRRHDAHRPIIAGHSHARASAWHNTAEKSWTPDDRRQSVEILHRDNPPPLDTIGIHIYADHPPEKTLPPWAVEYADYLRMVRAEADRVARPVFVGEFGCADGRDVDAGDVRTKFTRLLADLESTGVDLAALWVYDFARQNADWNVTFDNSRRDMLEQVIEANRRWNRAARANPAP